MTPIIYVDLSLEYCRERMDSRELLLSLNHAAETLRARTLGNDKYGRDYTTVRERGIRCIDGTGERFSYTVCVERQLGRDRRARLPKYRAWVFGRVDRIETTEHGDPAQPTVRATVLIEHDPILISLSF
jgi:hypothetical protein